MASTFLHGISLKNFRAVGTRAFIGPFSDVNFFVGPNNAGKSTVLLFLEKYLHPSAKGSDGWSRSFSPADAHLGQHVSQIQYALGATSAGLVEELRKRLPRQQQVDDLKAVIDALSRPGGLIWLQPDSSKRAPECLTENGALDRLLDSHRWSVLSSQLTQSHGGSLEHWKMLVLRAISQGAATNYPKVHLIPAIREISQKGEEFRDYSGKGLIDRLAELQNPPHDARDLRQKFDAINDFLRVVTERVSFPVKQTLQK